jgi:hypothetical protein
MSDTSLYSDLSSPYECCDVRMKLPFGLVFGIFLLASPNQPSFRTRPLPFLPAESELALHSDSTTVFSFRRVRINPPFGLDLCLFSPPSPNQPSIRTSPPTFPPGESESALYSDSTTAFSSRRVRICSPFGLHHRLFFLPSPNQPSIRTPPPSFLPAESESTLHSDSTTVFSPRRVRISSLFGLHHHLFLPASPNQPSLKSPSPDGLFMKILPSRISPLAKESAFLEPK